MSDFPKISASRGFQEGEYVLRGVKRRGRYHYHRYHYIIPAKLSTITSKLKEYFAILDSIEEVPNFHRYRRTHFEYIETAISAFCSLRNRIGSDGPFVVGSSTVSPIGWGSFGTKARTKIAKNYFHNIEDVFSYYRSMMHDKGYNIFAIDRNYQMPKTSDPLHVLAAIYDKSVNFVLSACILFLFDLVRFGGPDTELFDEVYFNDKRKGIRSCGPWLLARQEVFPKKTDDYLLRHNTQHVRLKSEKKPDNRPFYQKVNVKDVDTHILCSDILNWDEKVELPQIKSELNDDFRTIMGESEVDMDNEVSNLFGYC